MAAAAPASPAAPAPAPAAPVAPAPAANAAPAASATAIPPPPPKEEKEKATTPAAPRFDVDDFTARILNVGTPNCALLQTVTSEDISNLCQIAKGVFMNQPSLIELDPPVKVCGDTHGQYSDVLRLFDRGGFPPYVNYLFLGDYVDRGHQNLESILLFLCFKVKYPNNFFLLRGNHECAPINRVYGFYEECQRRYPEGRVWQTFQEVFNTMPFVGLIGGRILCMHGGLSPKLKHISQLKDIQRPAEPQNPSLQMDLLWADPDQHTKGWQQNTRGVSVVFGPDVVHDLLAELDLDLVARAHQVVQDGYEFFANKKLVTIFSAPHYCGQFDNAAAMMNVDTKLICSFHVMRPTAKPMKISAKN